MRASSSSAPCAYTQACSLTQRPSSKKRQGRTRFCSRGTGLRSVTECVKAHAEPLAHAPSAKNLQSTGTSGSALTSCLLLDGRAEPLDGELRPASVTDGAKSWPEERGTSASLYIKTTGNMSSLKVFGRSSAPLHWRPMASIMTRFPRLIRSSGEAQPDASAAVTSFSSMALLLPNSSRLAACALKAVWEACRHSLETDCALSWHSSVCPPRTAQPWQHCG
mmetsp:Transcript_173393/g.556184  ORF Transcript_173393/g.556184 Transcript_173393/m.556184 type:complete len:221 (-) Transcript_173393:819-1481(-)